MQGSGDIDSILLVEDDAYYASTLINLIDIIDVDIAIASNADDARRIITSRPFRLVILDLMLPPGQGIDPVFSRGGHLTGRILAQEWSRDFPEMPIIMHSSVRDRVVISWFEEKGIKYISKNSESAHESIFKEICGTLNVKRNKRRLKRIIEAIEAKPGVFGFTVDVRKLLDL